MCRAPSTNLLVKHFFSPTEYSLKSHGAASPTRHGKAKMYRSKNDQLHSPTSCGRANVRRRLNSAWSMKWRRGWVLAAGKSSNRLIQFSRKLHQIKQHVYIGAEHSNPSIEWTCTRKLRLIAVATHAKRSALRPAP